MEPPNIGASQIQLTMLLLNHLYQLLVPMQDPAANITESANQVDLPRHHCLLFWLAGCLFILGSGLAFYMACCCHIQETCRLQREAAVATLQGLYTFIKITIHYEEWMFFWFSTGIYESARLYKKYSTATVAAL